MSVGVLLYGPPASGKDTVTAALHTLDPQYSLFPRLKCGGGRTDGYRVVDRASLEELNTAGDIIWRNDRYGATYAVDRTGLIDHLQTGTPVVHLGQPAAIEAITNAVPQTRWFVVELWCDRPTAAERLRRRGISDVAERLRVWDATPRLAPPATTLDTAVITPSDAAQLISTTVDRVDHDRTH